MARADGEMTGKVDQLNSKENRTSDLFHLKCFSCPPVLSAKTFSRKIKESIVFTKAPRFRSSKFELIAFNEWTLSKSF